MTDNHVPDQADTVDTVDDATTITVPATLDEAAGRLTGIERLLTATRWERAALVYAFTTGDSGDGDQQQRHRRTDQDTGDDEHQVDEQDTGAGSLSVRAFAALGIAGLSSRTTVRHYRQAWAFAIDTGEAATVAPGDENVALPEREFPTQTANPAPNLTDPERRSALVDAAQRSGIGTGVVLAVAADPRPVVTAIAADTRTREFVRGALAECDGVTDTGGDVHDPASTSAGEQVGPIASTQAEALDGGDAPTYGDPGDPNPVDGGAGTSGGEADATTTSNRGAPPVRVFSRARQVHEITTELVEATQDGSVALSPQDMQQVDHLLDTIAANVSLIRSALTPSERMTVPPAWSASQ